MRHLGHAALVVALGVLAGCFDSLIDNPCAAGYQLADGQCVARVLPDGASADAAGDARPGDAGDAAVVDASIDAPGDAGLDAGAPPDALVCTAPLVECAGACTDLATDPQHCGACGRTCPSGICEAGHCVGELSGHIVGIGHDYRAHHPAMRRLLANAIVLADRADIAIARLRGSAAEASHTGTTHAITLGMAALGRAWHPVTIPEVPSATTLDDVDVLVVGAQIGDPSIADVRGLAWATAIDRLLQRGGVVIVLEGAGGVSHRFAAAANLFTATAVTEATGTHAFVVDAADAVVQQVLSPYLAETTSVAFEGLAGPVSTLQAPLVLHTTRY